MKKYEFDNIRFEKLHENICKFTKNDVYLGQLVVCIFKNPNDIKFSDPRIFDVMKENILEFETFDYIKKNLKSAMKIYLKIRAKFLKKNS